ncbi:MAG: Bifunctional ligase/repressor BirA [Syntrophus sp. SKADARSKE-3]|nr:Bifunctional ligase/repressor BirA [Syntrophus sp. SKADARSKE-3]
MKGAPEGDTVVAEAQSKGRGRLDRVWQSPKGRNIYLSVILRPPIVPSVAPQITLVAGLAVAELLLPYCPGRVKIKWPNDILIDGKKICGILTEMKSSAATGIDFVVLGIGINVNMVRTDFDDILKETATSLKMETGVDVDRLTLVTSLFELIEKWYRIFLQDGFGGIKDSFLSHTDMLGKRIQVVFNSEIQTGIATGIDDDGTIIMKDEKGVMSRVTAGDVSIMKG